MKMFYMECTEDELRANRGIMDAVVDACRGLLDGVYGTYDPTPQCTEEQEDEQEGGEE